MQSSQDNIHFPSPEPKGSAGPIVASVIIIILILAAGLYFLSKRAAIDNAVESRPEMPAETNSDNISDIEAELDASVFTESNDEDVQSVDNEVAQ